LNYTAQHIDQLAAEYVLGTLRGAARRRFDQLIIERADVRMTVWRWERYLSSFASRIKPQQPAQRVWRKIRRRIRAPELVTSNAFSWWRNLRVALPAAIAAAWLAVVLLPTQNMDRMAVFADTGATALWVISADLDDKLLRTEPLHAEASPVDKSYELWILPAEGPPLSLGLLEIRRGIVEIPITAQLAHALETAGSLAISLEPAGGSPTGLPTGPVIHQASLVKI